MTTLAYSGQLTIVTCWCGMRHAVPVELEDFQDHQHDNGATQTAIYCPLGHSHIRAGKGAAQKERERRERAEARATALADQLAAAEKAHAATKGQLTKTKKRVGKGVCPCCNRQFQNVSRHMATQHPKYAESATP